MAKTYLVKSKLGFLNLEEGWVNRAGKADSWCTFEGADFHAKRQSEQYEIIEIYLSSWDIEIAIEINKELKKCEH